MKAAQEVKCKLLIADGCQQASVELGIEDAYCAIYLTSLKEHRHRACVKKRIANREKESSNSGDENCPLPILFGYPTNTLGGSQVNRFLSTFVTRTPRSGEPLVDIQLIQQAVEKVTAGTLERKYMLSSSHCNDTHLRQKLATDRACHAYLIAAIAIGSLQAGYLHHGMEMEYYRKMNKALKPCHDQEQPEVILAHLAIASFCRKTGLSHEFKKHSGFAEVLLKCCTEGVPENVQKVYNYVVYAYELYAALQYPGTEVAILQTFLSQFAISGEEFLGLFPNILRACAKQTQFIPPHCPDQATVAAIRAVFANGAVASLFALIYITLQCFHDALEDRTISRNSRLAVLSEIQEFFVYASNLYGMSIKQLPPAHGGFMMLMKIIHQVLAGELSNAQKNLATVINESDYHTIFSCLSLPMAKHHIHFLIMILVHLRMEREYKEFAQKVNQVLLMMQHQNLMPEFLCHIDPQKDFSLCSFHTCTLLWHELSLPYPPKDDAI